MNGRNKMATFLENWPPCSWTDCTVAHFSTHHDKQKKKIFTNLYLIKAEETQQAE